jgi:glutaredoxin
MYEIFSMEGCAKCVDAAKLLTAKGLEFKVTKIDEDANAAAFIRREQHRSMPQIYKDGVLIPGGFAGLQAYFAKQE